MAGTCSRCSIRAPAPNSPSSSQPCSTILESGWMILRNIQALPKQSYLNNNSVYVTTAAVGTCTRRCCVWRWRPSCCVSTRSWRGRPVLCAQPVLNAAEMCFSGRWLRHQWKSPVVYRLKNHHNWCDQLITISEVSATTWSFYVSVFFRIFFVEISIV